MVRALGGVRGAASMVVTGAQLDRDPWTAGEGTDTPDQHLWPEYALTTFEPGGEVANFDAASIAFQHGFDDRCIRDIALTGCGLAFQFDGKAALIRSVGGAAEQ